MDALGIVVLISIAAFVAFVVGHVRGTIVGEKNILGWRFNQGITAGKKAEKKFWQKKLVEEGHGRYGIDSAGKIKFILFDLKPATPKIADGTERTD